jgi:hypothetical protein
MSRIINEFGLFGGGFSHGTCGDLKCDWCGVVHNEGADALHAEDDSYNMDESVSYSHFGGKIICEDCYEKFEDAMLYQMPAVLKWYRTYLDGLKLDVSQADASLKEVESCNV